MPHRCISDTSTLLTAARSFWRKAYFGFTTVPQLRPSCCPVDRCVRGDVCKGFGPLASVSQPHQLLFRILGIGRPGEGRNWGEVASSCGRMQAIRPHRQPILRTRRNATKDELPPSFSCMFVEALAILLSSTEKLVKSSGFLC